MLAGLPGYGGAANGKAEAARSQLMTRAIFTSAAFNAFELDGVANGKEALFDLLKEYDPNGPVWLAGRTFCRSLSRFLVLP